MPKHQITVEQLAREAGLELDETLVALWDAGWTEIRGTRDKLGRGEANRARRALGLVTRREIGYPEYWKELFTLDDKGFDTLLESLAVTNPFDGPKLRKRALNRLRAEARKRGLRTTAAAVTEVPKTTTETYARFQWIEIGHRRHLRYLSESEVETIHNALVEDFLNTEDPIDPPGVKNQTYLCSAVYRPHTRNGDILKYPTIEMAAAALLHSLVHDHPFHNGNKRTALVSMLVFLDENGLVLVCDEDDLFREVLLLAQHAIAVGPRAEMPDREVHAVAQWIHANSRWIEKGDRPMKWRTLRRILAAYGCEFEYPSGVGNRINISRVVTRKPATFLRSARKERLSTQTHYGDEGRDVQGNTIKKIRRELEIDDEHGVDSRAFYGGDEVCTGSFIIEYRKLLRRLAKL